MCKLRLASPCMFSLGILLLLSVEASAAAAVSESSASAPAVRGSIIARMLQEHEYPFTLYPYDTNYLLYTYTSNLNKGSINGYDWASNANKDEIKFQLSLGFPMWRGVVGDNSLLAFSYTQASWWQALNSAQSSPFRETNYEPQVFLGWASTEEFMGWTLRDIEVGLNHQSNGRAEPESRSWNRVYARLMAEQGNWQVDLKPWYRIPESTKSDDNPDIGKYLGYYRIKVGYAPGENVFSLSSRYNWNTGYGSAELGWSYPISRHVRFYTQLFSGYGESLIDYDHKQTRIGLGVMLNDMM